MKCILCEGEQTRLLGSMSTNQIIGQWADIYHMDVSHMFIGHDQVRLYHCDSCGLEFYNPLVSGDADFYLQLQAFDWYYMRDKWDYHTALKDIKKTDRILEIGCGTGHFIKILREKRIDVIGIELNEAAVNYAQTKGMPIYLKTLEGLVKDKPELFDDICLFQVLEHVENPREFIELCLKLLKPFGRLIITVPNNAGFIRRARNNLLNQPPHHLTLWSKTVFEFIAKKRGLKLRSVRYEPLADYHINWYIDIQLARINIKFPLVVLIKKAMRKALILLFHYGKVHRMLKGHSIYICLQKERN